MHFIHFTRYSYIYLLIYSLFVILFDIIFEWVVAESVADFFFRSIIQLDGAFTRDITYAGQFSKRKKKKKKESEGIRDAIFH